jgi:hypothetical protein
MGYAGDKFDARVGSDKAAKNGDAGIAEVSNMGLGSGDDMEIGSAGTSGKGDGTGVDRVVVSLAGSGVTHTFLGGGSSLSLLIHSWNGAHSYIVACQHFWML